MKTNGRECCWATRTLRTYGQCYWKLQSQFLVSTGEKELNGGKKWSCRGQKNTQLTIGVCENLHLWTFGEHRRRKLAVCRFKLTHYWRRAQNEIVAVVSPIIPRLRNESRALKRRHFRAKSAGRDKWQSTDSFHVAFLFGHFSCIWGLKFPGIIQNDLIANGLHGWMTTMTTMTTVKRRELMNFIWRAVRARLCNFIIKSFYMTQRHSSYSLYAIHLSLVE